jgi:N-acetylneuraminate synthase
MARTIKIGKRKIGGDAPCFIIAEVGINHNGDLSIAKKMIDMAVNAGCDAVKFQAYKADHLYSKKAGKLDWEDKKGKYSYDIYEANKSFEMPFEWIPELMKYCDKKKIIFFSSVWDEPSTDVLEKSGMALYKIGSSALTNIPLLEHVAKKKKPVFISLGGATLGEVVEALETIKKYIPDIVLMHCHLKYPSLPKNANVNIVNTIRYAFPDVVPGYSDHTEHPFDAPVVAVVNGAKVIEKHITLDKKMKGPDHFFALEPDELNLMVKKIREAEQKMKKGEQVEVNQEVLGSSEIKTYEDEQHLRDFAYTIIITLKNVKKGEKLTKENIRVLRTGKLERGLEPKFYKMLVEKGYKVIHDLPMGKAITWDDLIEK